MRQSIALILSGLCATIAANCYIFVKNIPAFIPVAILLLLCANLLPLAVKMDFPDFRTRMCNHGNLCLRSFIGALVISVVFQLGLLLILMPLLWLDWLLSVLVCTIVLAILFWNGMITVYLSSVQLGITHRAVGILLGLVPIANLIMLGKIIRVTDEEIGFETLKCRIDKMRAEDQICKTKYPVLLVHGFCFLDNRYINYWGRIPGALEKNGATIYYGEQPSALSIADSAKILAKRIARLVEDTGCEKVNIIAHSKGGLDCRYAIDQLGIGQYVASLTTINSPHRGCKFADVLLEKVPENIQRKIATTYNQTLQKLGDPNPDFMAAVRDLTGTHCRQFDLETPVPEGIYCQSYGSLQNSASTGKFPMNLSYHLVKYFDGDNDGIVGTDSFEWGSYYSLLTTSSKRGISHTDMIDFNRENIPGFDVREFYVQLVARLKQMGY